MTKLDDPKGAFRQLLMASSAAFAFAVAPQALAQDDQDTAVPDSAETQMDDADEIVVTGIRAALANAAALKRNADTAVDSITASDVNTLPDLSVAEALARVPGVVVQRIALDQRNGGDFPSPEGGGNLIRGLTLIRSEFNGREAFSANAGRALDFGTIPPELVGGVDVYKNTSADLIEGGIGGSINLRTLEPFDRDGLSAVATVDGTYTDLRKDVTPELSMLISNRWDVGGGEVGLLGSLSYSELNSDLNGFQIGQLSPQTIDGVNVAVPGGVQLRTNEVDRQRDSAYLAAQYENNAGTFRATAKYALINNEVEGDERTLEWFQDGESFGQYEFPGGITTTPFTSAGLPLCNGANDPNPRDPVCEQTLPVSALYESGVISNNLRDWTGSQGANFTNLGINQRDTSTTDDISLNLKWRAKDNLFFNLDGHYTTAEASQDRFWLGSRFFSDFTINADLDNPQLTLVPNTTGNLNPAFIRGSDVGGRQGSFADPANAYLLFAADQFQRNEGDLYAIRGDVEYEFEDDGWFDAVKFGARYSEREQTNRSAGLNWASVAAPWNGGYAPYDGITAGSEAVDYSDFFRGGVVLGENTTVLFPSRSLLRNYETFIGVQNNDPNIGADWQPLVNDAGQIDFEGRGTVGTITEETKSAYARLDIGQEFDNGMSLDANIGIRYTRADLDGLGQLNFAEITFDPDAVGGNDPSVFVPEAVAFSQQPNGAIEGPFDSNEFWLPSFNAKLNLNDDMLVRVGASKNVTRPRLGQLTPNQTQVPGLRYINAVDIPPGATTRPLIDIDVQQVNIFGGNPDLKPIESWNYDLSFEYYWGGENSFTAAAFRKDIKNNIIYASETRGTTTLDGDTVAVVFNGDLNQDEAEVQGIELAYQQFYDFLPGMLGNLGLQANYTYIDAETNAPLPVVDADGDGAPDSFERIFRYGVNNFLGLSEHAANVVGIYQDDSLEFRLAYNWRSDYLSSYRDFVTGNPIFQEDRGYLDGSFKYDISDALQFRVQAANILNTEAKATQQIDAEGQRFGRTNFIQDRRVKVGFRWQY